MQEVDLFIAELKQWQDEIKLLRQIILNCGLEEAFKWKQPCYTFNDKNVCMIANLKGYCAVSFFKGILLNDPHQVLQKAGENSYEGRIVKFISLDEITSQEAILKELIFQAIEVEKAGLKVEKPKTELVLAEELIFKMDENPELKEAFNSLTPGKQRGYNIYFTGAKQSKSRMNRVEKFIPRILKGYGIHDCVCGHSKRMPRCDGSHKFIKLGANIKSRS
jgi:uncharacterized protein YdeI (YjbR/CyaY-like superfamily)